MAWCTCRVCAGKNPKGLYIERSTKRSHERRFPVVTRKRDRPRNNGKKGKGASQGAAAADTAATTTKTIAAPAAGQRSNFEDDFPGTFMDIDDTGTPFQLDGPHDTYSSETSDWMTDANPALSYGEQEVSSSSLHLPL